MNRLLHSTSLLALLATLAGCAPTFYGMAPCSGDCINGQGKLTYARNAQTESGSFSRGIATGTHVISLPDGRTMTVPMLNGVPHGKAIISTAAGKQYEQEWAYGYPVKGKTIHANGDVYEGSYRTLLTATGALTLPHEGSYLTAAGHRYQGRFERIDDRVVFRGTLTPAGKRPAPAVAAAPVPADAAPLALAPLAPAEQEVLRARQTAWTPAAAAATKADPMGDRYFFDGTAYWQHRQGTTATVAAAAAPTAATLAPSLAAPARPAGTAPATSAPGSFNLIEGNTGKYMSPFTSDGVAAGWVDKAINAQIGGTLGAAAGAYAGQKALEQVPFVGGFLGNKVGKAAGRTIALNAVGGEAFLRESSDISFNDVNEMARWLVETHGQHTKFNEIMKAAFQIYPELQQAVLQAQYARR